MVVAHRLDVHRVDERAQLAGADDFGDGPAVRRVSQDWERSGEISARNLAVPPACLLVDAPWPIPKMIPAFLTAASILTQSSRDVAMGFSHRMWYPCAAKARVTSRCILSWTAIMTASARRFPMAWRVSAEALSRSCQVSKTRV